jgi:uncharacterized RDD family membrane protein YckC
MRRPIAFGERIAMTNAPPPPPTWHDTHAEGGPVRYVGFWLRLVGWIVDTLVLVVFLEFVSIFLPLPSAPAPPKIPSLELLWQYWLASLPPLKMAIGGLVTWAYFAFQESSSAQATLGKRLLGIRVGAADGSRLSLGLASVRAWPLYLNSFAWIGGGWLGAIVALAGFVAVVAVAFSSRKQGLHDKMAGAFLMRR